MPYITQEFRSGKESLIQILGQEIKNEGDLNYVITRLVLRYIKHRGLSYKVLNAVAGVFQCAAAEFYRRIVAPYENRKIEENTDIPEYQTLFRDIAAKSALPNPDIQR